MRILDLSVAAFVVAAVALWPTPGGGCYRRAARRLAPPPADPSTPLPKTPQRVPPNSTASTPNPACLPEALDLCAVVLGAGGTIRDTVETLGASGPGEIRGHCRAVGEQCDRGMTLDSALRGLQTQLGPQFQPLTGTLLLAHIHGGSVAPLLSRLATDANTARRQRGEAKARRLPVSLLVPLVVCSLPSVVVGVLIPMAVVSLRQITI